MERNPIRNSSNIAEAGYDAAARVLEVMFFDGNIYWYFDVPENVAQGLWNPPRGSPGEYFHAKIMGHYDYTKV